MFCHFHLHFNPETTSNLGEGPSFTFLLFNLHRYCMNWSLSFYELCAVMNISFPYLYLWWGEGWSKTSKVNTLSRVTALWECTNGQRGLCFGWGCATYMLSNVDLFSKMAHRLLNGNILFFFPPSSPYLSLILFDLSAILIFLWWQTTTGSVWLKVSSIILFFLSFNLPLNFSLSCFSAR